MGSDHAQFAVDVQEYFGALPQEAFETAYCLFCPPQTPSEFQFVKGTMHIVKCECGFLFNQRQPTQKTLNEFYSRSRAMNTWATLKQTHKEERRQIEKFGDTVEFLHDSGVRNVLDIGCGTGKFLSLLSNSIDKVGVDQHETSLAVAKANGVQTINASIEEFFDTNKETYDAITLWGLVEHNKRPKELLARCYQALNENGVVVICVPNAESSVVLNLWEDCYTFCPQHLWYFNPRNLIRLLKESDFHFLNYHTVETESLPILKKNLGHHPYDNVAILNYQGALDEMDRIINCMGWGYKMILIGSKGCT